MSLQGRAFALFLALLGAMFATPAGALDVNGQLVNAVAERSASDPVLNVVEGRVYWNTAAHTFKYYNGTDWLTGATTANKLSAFAATTSNELDGVISDDTGSGALVFANSPALVTPDLGTPSAATLTNATGLPVSTGISGLGTGVASWLADPTSAKLATALTNETGSGAAVFGTTPTLVTPLIDDYLDVNEEAAPSTPSAGKVRVYAKTDKKIYKKDSDGIESEIGSGGAGSGEKNYAAAGTSTATGWTCVGDLDVATTTTAADLPREQTTGTGIKITADSNTQSTADYCYFDFTLDDVDVSKKLKLAFAKKITGSYVSGDLAAIITTQSDRTTAIATPITSSIDAYDYDFSTSFDATTTLTLSLVIRATTDMTTDAGVVLSDLIVGPGTKPQGAVVSEFLACSSYSITGSSSGTLSVGTGGSNFYQCFQRRVGAGMEVRLDGRFGSSGTTVPTGTWQITVPNGLSVDTTKVGNANGTTVLGIAQIGDNDTGRNYFMQVVYSASAGTIQMIGDTYSAGGAVTNTFPITWTTSDQFRIWFTVPISTWAGSGTVNLLGTDVIYSNYRLRRTDVAGGSLTNSYSTIPFATADFESPSASAFSGGTFTAPATGKYKVSARVWLASAPVSYLRLKIVKNGSTIMGYAQSATVVASISENMSLSAGDTIIVQGVLDSSTKALDTTSGFNSLNIERLADYSAGDGVGFGLASSTSAGLVSRETTTTTTPSWTGAATTSASTFYWSKVGKTVTVTWTRNIGLTCSAAVFNAAAASIPSGYEPISDTFFSYPQYQDNGSASGPGRMNFSTTGTMQIAKSAGGSFTVSGGTCGWYEGSASYVTN